MPSGGEISSHHDVVVIGTRRRRSSTGTLGYSVALAEREIRTPYTAPAHAYGYELAASDALPRMHLDVPQAMRLPSQARRI